MRSFYSLSLRLLIRRPGKTFGSIMGIALGVAVIVAAISAADAARLQLNSAFTSLLGSADLVISHARPFDAERALKAIEGQPVEGTASQLFYPARVNLRSAGQKSQTVGISVFGLNPSETGRFWEIKMTSGKFTFSNNHVVVSKSLARLLNVRPGGEIEVFTGGDRVRKRVAGVLAEVGLGEASIPAVYMDLKTARRHRQISNKISFMFLKLEPGAKVAEVKKGLAHRLGPDIKVGRTPATSEYALKMIDTLSQLLFAFGFFTVLVGALLIYQSANVSAAQMVPTLALIKSLGATRGQLVKVFLLESLIVGGLAAIVGTAIGFVLASAVTRGLVSMLAGGRPQLAPSPRLFLMMIFFGIGLSISATCLPIIRSSRVSVAEALRSKGADVRRRRRHLLAPLTRRLDSWLEMISPTAVVARKSFANNFGRLRFTAVCLIAGLAMIIGGQLGMGAGKKAMDQYFAAYTGKSYIVRAAEMPGGDATARMPLATARQLKKMAGVKEVIPFYLGGAHYRGREVMMQSAIPAETRDWIYIKGDPRLAGAKFRSGGWVAITTSFAKKHKVNLGDTIDLAAGGYQRRFRVAAEIVSVREAVLVSWRDMEKHFRIKEVDDIFVLPIDDAAYRTLGPRLDKFAQRKGYYFLTGPQFLAQMDGYVKMFSAVLLAITGSVLILTALALANIMVVGALERRRLFGVLRGQGMTRRQLVNLLVLENVAVGIVSLPAGLALGYGVGRLFIVFIRTGIGATVTESGGLWILPVSALLMLTVLYLTAVFPARRIASTPVAEALRYE